MSIKKLMLDDLEIKIVRKPIKICIFVYVETEKLKFQRHLM